MKNSRATRIKEFPDLHFELRFSFHWNICAPKSKLQICFDAKLKRFTCFILHLDALHCQNHIYLSFSLRLYLVKFANWNCKFCYLQTTTNEKLAEKGNIFYHPAAAAAKERQRKSVAQCLRFLLPNLCFTRYCSHLIGSKLLSICRRSFLPRWFNYINVSCKCLSVTIAC